MRRLQGQSCSIPPLLHSPPFTLAQLPGWAPPLSPADPLFMSLRCCTASLPTPPITFAAHRSSVSTRFWPGARLVLGSQPPQLSSQSVAPHPMQCKGLQLAGQCHRVAHKGPCRGGPCSGRGVQAMCKYTWGRPTRLVAINLLSLQYHPQPRAAAGWRPGSRPVRGSRVGNWWRRSRRRSRSW